MQYFRRFLIWVVADCGAFAFSCGRFLLKRRGQCYSVEERKRARNGRWSSTKGEPAPHPPKDQLPNVSYCITSPPPWPEAILLGFQHYIVMLGTTVVIPTALVPQMGGGNEEKAKVIQSSLFVAGLNTLLQTTFGTRLPAVMGGSYTFVAPTISIILSGRWSDPDPISKLKR